jgi:hypothetical protein
MGERPPRPRCPFYGFHWPEKSHTLTDSGGAECGLDFERCGPCSMEERGQTPDYEACPVAERLRPILEACKKNVTFCPAETAPAGLSMEEWKKRVMVRKRSAG